MFKMVRLYQLPLDFDIPGQAELDKILADYRFQQIGAQEAHRAGFNYPFMLHADAQNLTHVVGDNLFFAVKSQTKSVPKDYLFELMQPRLNDYERTNGRSMPRKEQNELKESIATSLYPNLIPKTAITLSCLNIKSKIIYVAAAPNGAEDVLELLRKALGSLPCIPYFEYSKLQSAMQSWCQGHDLPNGLQLGNNVRFKSDDESKSSANFANINILDDNVVAQTQDKICCAIEVVVPDNITATIKSDLTIANIQLSDQLLENEPHQEDPKAALDGQLILRMAAITKLLESLREQTADHKAE